MSNTEITIIYTPVFLKQLKKSDPNLQIEIKEKITLFKDKANHERLKTHKLNGKMKDLYSFSVTYAHRIVFVWKDDSTAVFFSFGDHKIYR